MSEKIEPALTPDEWRRGEKRLDQWSRIVGGDDIVIEGPDPQEAVTLRKPNEIAALIALANAALPDNDPRKITREMITKLQMLLSAFEADDHVHDWYPAVVDALESYLPPPAASDRL